MGEDAGDCVGGDDGGKVGGCVGAGTSGVIHWHLFSYCIMNLHLCSGWERHSGWFLFGAGKHPEGAGVGGGVGATWRVDPISPIAAFAKEVQLFG